MSKSKQRLVLVGMAMVLFLILAASAKATTYRLTSVEAPLARATGQQVQVYCQDKYSWAADPSRIAYNQAYPDRELYGYHAYDWRWDGRQWQGIPRRQVFLSPKVCGQLLRLVLDPNAVKLPYDYNAQFYGGVAALVLTHEAFHAVTPNEANTECMALGSVERTLRELGVVNRSEEMWGANRLHSSLPAEYQGVTC